MTRLVLCRHARSGDAAGAVRLADALRSLPLVAVYTSPLARAVETATPVAVAHGLEPIEVADLRELDFGDVDGLRFDELPRDLRRSLLERPTEVAFPGGESYGELRTRVLAALAEIVARHPGAAVAIVSHAGPIRAALATWLLMADEGVFRLDQRHASVNIVDWHDGSPFMRLMNAEAPLGARFRSGAPFPSGD
jgi:broad specificity phosphatase PhoE